MQARRLVVRRGRCDYGRPARGYQAVEAALADDGGSDPVGRQDVRTGPEVDTSAGKKITVAPYMDVCWPLYMVHAGMP